MQPHAKFPPSLRNMYQELENDIGCHRTSPHLQDWAREGVLLLNTVLTVRQGGSTFTSKYWMGNIHG